MPLAIKGKIPGKAKREGPVWAGPESTADNGGITFSLLSRFLCCRERFRLLVVEGLKPGDTFDVKLEYGNMWHACEEAFAGGRDYLEALKDYCRTLLQRYPMQQELTCHWYDVCQVQFPLYVDYWARHKEVLARTPLLQEQVFDVPYPLPSGRTVRLRGKWDSVDLVGKGKGAGIWLQENKTKSRIDEIQMRRQLSFDLQTQLYLVALSSPEGLERFATNGVHPIRGVRYNVVRRTEHRVGKKETEASFCDRLTGIIKDSPDEWFMRWNVEVSAKDIERFRQQCLDPILEQLCDWWDWVSLDAVAIGVNGPFNPDDGCENSKDESVRSSIHYRFPYGVWNPALEGGVGDLDGYLDTGSDAGLRRVDEMFPELRG